MNDGVSAPLASSAQQAAIQGESPTPTAGALLRQAREAEGLHIAALAVALKVPVKKLEALESDRLDLLSDMVFARALAASFCRILKVDPTPILARLPRANGPHLKTDETGINAPFRAFDGSGASVKMLDWLRKPLGLAILALLLGSLLLFMLPQSGWWARMSSSPPVRFTPPSSVPPEPGSPPSARPSLAASTAPEATLLTPVEVTPNSSPQAVTAQAGSPPTTAMAAEQVLMVKAIGPSWVEVIDAQGVVQVRRVLKTGEKLQVPGLAPFSVVLGKPENVEVVVRGSPLRPQLSGQDKVLRFEVK